MPGAFRSQCFESAVATNSRHHVMEDLAGRVMPQHISRYDGERAVLDTKPRNPRQSFALMPLETACERDIGRADAFLSGQFCQPFHVALQALVITGEQNQNKITCFARQILPAELERIMRSTARTLDIACLTHSGPRSGADGLKLFGCLCPAHGTG
jgi:hypothetical protein